MSFPASHLPLPPTVHLPPAMSRVDGQLVEVQVTKVLGEEETAKMSSKSEHD